LWCTRDGYHENGKWFFTLGHDISPEENQYQAGLNFAISYKKPFDFIGKEKTTKN
jgi:glycine cleavage system aminomethyltransferase T